MKKQKVWHYWGRASANRDWCGCCNRPSADFFLRITEVASESGGFSGEVIIEVLEFEDLAEEEVEAIKRVAK